jgi:DNA-binding MarR family transcriptional regulator
MVDAALAVPQMNRFSSHQRINLLPMDTVETVFHGATALAQRMRAERPRDGTTLSMISAMSHLNREGPMSAGRLAALQRAKPQTVTRTLARLTELGLITRRPGDDDRRRILVELTPAGVERLAADMRPRKAWLEQAMESLTPTEREVLRLAGELMSKLVTWTEN